MLFNWSDHVPAVKKAFGALGKSHPKIRRWTRPPAPATPWMASPAN